MRRRRWWLVPVGMVGLVVFAFVGGEVVRLLWNWLTPMLFGWRQINFWQALGLLALCRILFGGWGGRGPRGRRRARWENMTPEERERMRARFEGRCGAPPPNPAPTA